VNIEECVVTADIEADFILVYTRHRRGIAVSSRLPPAKRLQFVDMAREISKDHLKLNGNDGVILIRHNINDEEEILVPDGVLLGQGAEAGKLPRPLA
jgi:hypothetical protein